MRIRRIEIEARAEERMRVSDLIFILLFLLPAPLFAEFRVGIVGPLTGPVAVFGKSAQNGVELAKEERADLFTGIRFFYEDDAFESSKSVAGYRKLRDVDAIDMIIPVGVKAGHSIAPITESEKFPFVGIVYTSDPAIGRKYVIRFVNSTEQYAQRLLEYLRSKGQRDFKMVKTDMEFVNGFLDGFEGSLRDNENMEIVGSVLPSETDFRALVGRLKSRNVDPLGLFFITGQISEFMRQAKVLQYRPKVFGADFLSDKSEIDRAVGMLEGAVFADNNVDESFRARYRKRFGNDDQIVFGSLTYSLALLIGELFNGDTAKPGADEILTRFEKAPSKASVTGTYHFVDTPKTGKYFHFPIVIKEIKNGEITVKEQ